MGYVTGVGEGRVKDMDPSDLAHLSGYKGDAQ